MSEQATRVVGGGPGDDSGVQQRRDREPRRGANRWLVLAAVAGLIGTLAFGTLWVGEQREDRRTERARDAARNFVVALANFDGETINEDFERIASYATDDFVEELEQFFNADTRRALKEVQASSRGEIRDVYLQSLEDGRARFFAVVDQTIVNNRLQTPQTDELRLEFAMRLVDGAWRVYDLQVLQAPPAVVAEGVREPATTTTTGG